VVAALWRNSAFFSTNQWNAPAQVNQILAFSIARLQHSPSPSVWLTWYSSNEGGLPPTQPLPERPIQCGRSSAIPPESRAPLANHATNRESLREHRQIGARSSFSRRASNPGSLQNVRAIRRATRTMETAESQLGRASGAHYHHTGRKMCPRVNRRRNLNPGAPCRRGERP
jgi:hypothetical protein